MADTTTQTTSTTGADKLGTESSLSNWAGPYVTEMLGRGQALASQPYQAYTGPLTAGSSTLQNQAFGGVAGLALPTNMGAFTPQSFTDTGVAQKYMNPYIKQALDPQIAEAKRQAQMQQMADMAKMTKAGAYGGSRQALLQAENNRNLLANLAGITGKGYSDAYSQAMQQFNTEQGRQQAAQDAANTYGLAALQKQADLGAQQRMIEQEGITADKLQFEEERDFPYKQVQYMQSLLQSLPIAAQSVQYSQPSFFQQMMTDSSDIGTLIESIFGD
jgi:hypothetical protein